jgi:hypothetical protein
MSYCIILIMHKDVVPNTMHYEKVNCRNTVLLLCKSDPSLPQDRKLHWTICKVWVLCSDTHFMVDESATEWCWLVTWKQSDCMTMKFIQIWASIDEDKLLDQSKGSLVIKLVGDNKVNNAMNGNIPLAPSGCGRDGH